MNAIRTRWAALGAVVAITLGGGGIGLVSATTPDDAVAFVPITPCRVFDTRPNTEFNVGPRSTPIGPEEEHSVTAIGTTGNCTGVPSTATAVSMNVTALDATLPTFLAIYATGATRPDASGLNPQPGQPPTPNAVTTELSPAGQFTVYNRQGNVNVFADINGYYVAHHHDDRYYTQDEVDGLVQSAKSINLDPLTLNRTGTGYVRSSTAAGTGLRMFRPSSLDLMIALPTDYTAGSVVQFDLFWHGFDTSCDVAFGVQRTLGSRFGEVEIDIESDILPEIVRGPIAPNQVRRFSFRVAASASSDTTLQPGDLVKLQVVRSSTGDTCDAAEGVYVDGARLTYG